MNKMEEKLAQQAQNTTKRLQVGITESHEVAFNMQLTPRGQGRPRATIAGGHPSIYEDKKDKEYKKLMEDLVHRDIDLRKAAKEFKGQEGPVHVTLIFHMKRPKYRDVKVRTANENECFFYADKRPDMDNLEKAVLDAMEGFLWEDDGCIASVFKTKVYAKADEKPHIEFHAKKIGRWLSNKSLGETVGMFQTMQDKIALDGNNNPMDGERKIHEYEKGSS